MNKEQVIQEYLENRDIADDILECLVENSFQRIEYIGTEYMFNCFHYDGVLLDCLTDEFRQVYVGVYYLHKLVIL